jgi:hypothetical protein
MSSVGTLGEIRKALAKTVLGINGMRVAEHMPEQVNPPMVVIQLDRLDYHGAMQGGLRTFQFLLIAIVGRMGERSSQELLDRVTDFDGPESIRDVVEADPTLGGVVWAVKVTGARAVRPINIGDAAYLGVEFEVEVQA